MLKLYVEAITHKVCEKRNAYKIIENSNNGRSFSYLFTSSGKTFGTPQIERTLISVARYPSSRTHDQITCLAIVYLAIIPDYITWNDWMKMNYNVSGRKHLWPNLRCCLCICLEILRKTKKNLRIICIPDNI
jgi:hypothetical protein